MKKSAVFHTTRVALLSVIGAVVLSVIVSYNADVLQGVVMNGNCADNDGDGVCNDADICPEDPMDDFDGDGFCDSDDNCPDVPNVDQADADSDGAGDLCEGICGNNVVDAGEECDDSEDDRCMSDCTWDPCRDPSLTVCPMECTDDECSGACADTDADGVCDEEDMCPADASNDSDGDGVCDSDDVCPSDYQNDFDGDGFCDSDDNCPDTPNIDQTDEDTDGLGDVCDEPCPDPALQAAVDAAQLEVNTYSSVISGLNDRKTVLNNLLTTFYYNLGVAERNGDRDAIRTLRESIRRAESEIEYIDTTLLPFWQNFLDRAQERLEDAQDALDEATAECASLDDDEDPAPPAMSVEEEDEDDGCLFPFWC